MTEPDDGPRARRRAASGRIVSCVSAAMLVAGAPGRFHMLRALMERRCSHARSRPSATRTGVVGFLCEPRARARGDRAGGRRALGARAARSRLRAGAPARAAARRRRLRRCAARASRRSAAGRGAARRLPQRGARRRRPRSFRSAERHVVIEPERVTGVAPARSLEERPRCWPRVRQVSRAPRGHVSNRGDPTEMPKLGMQIPVA